MCNDLRAALHAIDRKSYPAYKSLTGEYQFPTFRLFIDRVQGDPFAAPSSLHIEVSHTLAGFPPAYYKGRVARIALQDYLIRQMAAQFERYQFQAKGSGKSGLLSITRCGQEVLERSACEITQTKILIRFHAGFPAYGRTIDARELEKMLFDFLPRCVEESLFYQRLDPQKVKTAIFLAEDQAALRDILKKEKLVAFVANGAVLPRESGVSDLPLKDAVPFVSPASMKRTFSLPHRGQIDGMAIPQGITLIVGGGYHGKSTLLEALQAGVYNHIGGDGREYVLTEQTAAKLRAEDGRSIQKVDISLFIHDLPNGKDTSAFSTLDASGSTSQAAGVIEAIESGSQLLLMDEDTSATNFMVRDELMQQVVRREKEPITPFLERVRALYEQEGISTILVAGSSGAFFYVADRILQMDCYRPLDITGRVKELCKEYPAPRIQASDFAVPQNARVFLPCPRREEVGRGRRGGEKDRGGKIKLFGRDSFSLDRETVDLRCLEQLADAEQTAALAYLLRFGLEKVLDGRRTVQETVQLLDDTLAQKGWGAFCGSYIPCGLAKPRVQEVFACLNRFRGYGEYRKRS